MARGRRRLLLALPSSLRARAALRIARGLIRDTYPGSRALVRIRRGVACVDCAARCSARFGNRSNRCLRFLCRGASPDA